MDALKAERDPASIYHLKEQYRLTDKQLNQLGDPTSTYQRARRLVSLARQFNLPLLRTGVPSYLSPNVDVRLIPQFYFPFAGDAAIAFKEMFNRAPRSLITYWVEQAAKLGNAKFLAFVSIQDKSLLEDTYEFAHYCAGTGDLETWNLLTSRYTPAQRLSFLTESDTIVCKEKLLELLKHFFPLTADTKTNTIEAATILVGLLTSGLGLKPEDIDHKKARILIFRTVFIVSALKTKNLATVKKVLETVYSEDDAQSSPFPESLQTLLLILASNTVDKDILSYVYEYFNFADKEDKALETDITEEDPLALAICHYFHTPLTTPEPCSEAHENFHVLSLSQILSALLVIPNFSKKYWQSCFVPPNSSPTAEFMTVMLEVFQLNVNIRDISPHLANPLNLDDVDAVKAELETASKERKDEILDYLQHTLMGYACANDQKSIGRLLKTYRDVIAQNMLVSTLFKLTIIALDKNYLVLACSLWKMCVAKDPTITLGNKAKSEYPVSHRFFEAAIWGNAYPLFYTFCERNPKHYSTMPPESRINNLCAAFVTGCLPIAHYLTEQFGVDIAKAAYERAKASCKLAQSIKLFAQEQHLEAEHTATSENTEGLTM